MLKINNPITFKKMDNEKTYVDKVNDWLNADPTTRTIEEGAKLMLQGNRNKILHQNVIHRNNFDKVVYELEKIIGNDRVKAGDVAAKKPTVDITKMEAQAYALNNVLVINEFKGKRADHDSLPEEIKQIPEANKEIYSKMRSLFEKLKVLNGENYSPEKRLPFLTALLELDEQSRKNWDTYDKFDANAPVIVEADKKLPEGGKIDANRVSSNRKYLSDNKKKLAALIAEGKTDKSAELLAKMQVRVNELVSNGQTFAADQLEELKALGIIAPVAEETKIEPVADTQVITQVEEVILPVGETTEETPEENVISQIKTLLKNNIAKEVIIPTILSLGNFKGLELTPEVVEDLYNHAVEQEMNSVE